MAASPCRSQPAETIHLVIEQQRTQTFAHGNYEKNERYEIWARPGLARMDRENGTFLVALDQQRFWWIAPTTETYVALDLDFSLESLATPTQQANLDRLGRWLAVREAETVPRRGPRDRTCDGESRYDLRTLAGSGSLDICLVSREAPWIDAYRALLDAHARLSPSRRAWFERIDQPGVVKALAYRHKTDSSSLVLTERLAQAIQPTVVPPTFFEVPAAFREQALDIDQLFGFVGPQSMSRFTIEP